MRVMPHTTRIRRSKQQASSTPTHGRMLHQATYLTHRQYGAQLQFILHSKIHRILITIAYPTFNTATLKHTHVREDASPGHIPESRPVWAQLQLTLLSKIHRVLITIGSLYVHVHAYISRSYTHAGPNNAQVPTGSNAQLRARAVTISNSCYSLQCLLEAPGVALLINTSRPNWGPRP